MVIELIQAYPRWSIIVISGFVSLFISLINYFVLDKEKVREGRARQKELNKQMKESKHDPVKTMEIQKELMSHAMQNMKNSFRPMLITIIPILVIFWWIRGIFAETTIASVWLWWYIGSSIVFSIIFRKVFKLP